MIDVMSLFIVNPAGKVSAVENEEQVTYWLKRAGYRKATKEEIAQHTTRAEDLVKEQAEGQSATQNPEKKQSMDGIYLATVSQGGKDGYGIASAKMYDEIRALGTSVSFHQENQKVGLLFHNPYSITSLDNDYLVIYTMFESDKIPEDWNYYLKYADLVLVPSKWCQEVFAKSGIKSTVVPLGYDEKVFQFKQREVKRDKRKDFTFLHYNAFNLRKGFREVWQAFTEEFDKAEPVKMVFKTTLENLPTFASAINPHQYPNIEIIRGSKYDSELKEIIDDADCMVFPSMGEGFGLPPLEAMATGLPTIVPNAHGISEYFNKEFMYEAKVKEMVPALYSRYKGVDVGKMVKCDVKQLRQQMRYIYEHQEEALEKGRKASEYVKQWTIEKTCKALLEELKKLTENEPKQRAVKNVLDLEAV